MKTSQLEIEHDHLKRDFWHGMEDAKARSQRTADAAASLVKSQTAQLLAFEKLSSKSESTERVLKWVLAVVTSVGVGTAVIVLSQVLRSGPS